MFLGSYQPTPRTVLHALKNDLGISVKELAQDKEEDLRRLFSCWWSKPLSGCCIFDRILCFEGGFKKGSRPPKVIGEVFRSLVSLSKDQDVKVMMPLLASGGQVCFEPWDQLWLFESITKFRKIKFIISNLKLKYSYLIVNFLIWKKPEITDISGLGYQGIRNGFELGTP